VHVLGADEGGAVEEFVADVADDDDGGGEVGLEEVLCALGGGHAGVADGGEAGPELGDEHEAVEAEADPRADDAGLGAEGELIEGVALDKPALAEADVAQADGAPGEDGREARQREHPREGLALGFRVGGREVGEETEKRRDGDAHYGSAFSVDVSEDPRRLTLVRKRGQRARGAVDGRVPHGQDSNHDNCVHDRRETIDPRVADGNHKRRCLGVGAR
ncbi:hypothetical protein GP486_007595, partial [Trichoglossum hirsutum]